MTWISASLKFWKIVYFRHIGVFLKDIFRIICLIKLFQCLSKYLQVFKAWIRRCKVCWRGIFLLCFFLSSVLEIRNWWSWHCPSDLPSRFVYMHSKWNEYQGKLWVRGRWPLIFHFVLFSAPQTWTYFLTFPEAYFSNGYQLEKQISSRKQCHFLLFLILKF